MRIQLGEDGQNQGRRAYQEERRRLRPPHTPSRGKAVQVRDFCNADGILEKREMGRWRGR